MRSANSVKLSWQRSRRSRNRMLGDLRAGCGPGYRSRPKLVGVSLDEKKAPACALAEFFSESQTGKVVVLEGAGWVGHSAEVVSSLLALTVDEQAIYPSGISCPKWVHRLRWNFASTILGGLVIYVGDKKCWMARSRSTRGTASVDLRIIIPT